MSDEIKKDDLENVAGGKLRQPGMQQEVGKARAEGMRQARQKAKELNSDADPDGPVDVDRT
ncbi:MAG: hypothetical protein GY716_22875 [bacterium]|nr:hypothetical protein [bacterium]